jgi:hypothetical protein
MRTKNQKLAIVLALILTIIPLTSSMPIVMGTNATTSIHIIKYADNNTILADITKTYQWLKDNLPTQGDGKTHYYHQGPIFEGDMWDPSRTQNLKDKGAVMGTSIKDLCELVGGMSPKHQVMLRSVDGWHTSFAYENIYEPQKEQGTITLCWYNGEDALFGERYGEGYPGNYYTAIQLVFLASTTNKDGQYVFGNSDMKVSMPDEKYQHFYEGLPSTNGLSGKWISEVIIYSGEVPDLSNNSGQPTNKPTAQLPLIPIAIGVVGIIIIVSSIIILYRRRLK